MSCGCRKKTIVKKPPASTLSSSGNFANSEEIIVADESQENQLVNVEYFGPNEQNFSIRSRLDPQVRYKFGNNAHNKIKTVFLKDAQYLVGKVGRDNLQYYKIVTGLRVEDMDPQAALGRVLSG